MSYDSERCVTAIGNPVPDSTAMAQQVQPNYLVMVQTGVSYGFYSCAVVKALKSKLLNQTVYSKQLTLRDYWSCNG